MRSSSNQTTCLGKRSAPGTLWCAQPRDPELVKLDPRGMGSLQPGAEPVPVALRCRHSRTGAEPVVQACQKVFGKFHDPACKLPKVNIR